MLGDHSYAANLELGKEVLFERATYPALCTLLCQIRADDCVTLFSGGRHVPRRLIAAVGRIVKVDAKTLLDPIHHKVRKVPVWMVSEAHSPLTPMQWSHDTRQAWR